MADAFGWWLLELVGFDPGECGVGPVEIIPGAVVDCPVTGKFGWEPEAFVGLEIDDCGGDAVIKLVCVVVDCPVIGELGREQEALVGLETGDCDGDAVTTLLCVVVPCVFNRESCRELPGRVFGLEIDGFGDPGAVCVCNIGDTVLPNVSGSKSGRGHFCVVMGISSDRSFQTPLPGSS